jgi:hypothetical protein
MESLEERIIKYSKRILRIKKILHNPIAEEKQIILKAEKANLLNQSEELQNQWVILHELIQSLK